MDSENRNITAFFITIKDFYYFLSAEAVNQAVMNMGVFKTI